MNKNLISPTNSEYIEFDFDPNDEKKSYLSIIDSLLYIQNLQYGSYVSASGSISKNMELGLHEAFIGTSSVDLIVYNKFDVLYKQIQDEVFRFKRFISSEFKISENILSKIAQTISKLNYCAISFDLSSDLNFSVRIQLDSYYLLIVNIPISEPEFFRDNQVFFSLFHANELLITFKKEFNELIEGILTLNS